MRTNRNVSNDKEDSLQRHHTSISCAYEYFSNRVTNQKAISVPGELTTVQLAVSLTFGTVILKEMHIMMTSATKATEIDLRTFV